MSAPSLLIIQHLLDHEDPTALSVLRCFRNGKELKILATKIFKDPRPWARQLLKDYLQQGLLCLDHPPFIKNLYKMAEAAQDWELLLAFSSAFDRLPTRAFRTRFRRRTTTWFMVAPGVLTGRHPEIGRAHV